MTGSAEPDPAAVDLTAIRRAAAAIAGTIARSPVVEAPWLSERLQAQVFLKLETQHATGSFKERGALNTLLALPASSRARGVTACSAGNHAQGLAYHARRLGVPALIVMPRATPFSKIARTEGFGAEVVLAGDDLDGAEQEMRRRAVEDGLVVVHPYDDIRIVAGQGTVGLELLEDLAELDVLVVPVGGGGLASGMAVAAKAIRPQISVIGVQSAAYPFMHHALRGLPPPASGVSTMAEGIAVKRPGQITRALLARALDDLVLVEESAIETAVHLLCERQKLVAEGAGAAGVAALLVDPGRFRDKRVATVICGGNIDSRLLAMALLRGLARDDRLVSLRVEIQDQPGALARITGIVAGAGGNIVEIDHRRMFFDVPLRLTEVDMLIETRSSAHVSQIMDALAQAGVPATRLSPRKDA